jgi:hypothetical protein
MSQKKLALRNLTNKLQFFGKTHKLNIFQFTKKQSNCKYILFILCTRKGSCVKNFTYIRNVITCLYLILLI